MLDFSTCLQTFLIQIIYLLVLLHTFVVLVTSDFTAKTNNRRQKNPKETDAPSVATRQSTRKANLHAAPLAGLNEDTVKKSTTTKKSERKGGKGDSKDAKVTKKGAKVTNKDKKEQDSNKKTAKSAGKTEAKSWSKTKETKKRDAEAKAIAAAKAKAAEAKASKNARAAAQAKKKAPPPTKRNFNATKRRASSQSGTAAKRPKKGHDDDSTTEDEPYHSGSDTEDDESLIAETQSKKRGKNSSKSIKSASSQSSSITTSKDKNTAEYWKNLYKQTVEVTNKRLQKARDIVQNKNNEIVGLKKTVKHLGEIIPHECVNKETKDKVWKTCKNEKFRTVKFISSESQLMQVTEEILDSYKWDDYTYWEEEEDETDDEIQRRENSNAVISNNRALWIKTYHKEVLAAFNKRRSYTQEWCKDEFFKLLEAGKTPPEPKLILKIAQRKVNLKKQEEMKAFVWYWDHLLPGVGGAKQYWSASIRHHETISKAHLPNEENKLCITIGSEAFLALIYDGCYPKWLAIHEWQKANPGQAFCKAKEERKKPIYKSKYFDNATGQKLFGGVPPETLEYFIELKELVKNGRESKRCAKLEEACLALVQKENQVLEEEEEEDDSEGSSKKKKRKAVVLPKEIKTFGDEE